MRIWIPKLNRILTRKGARFDECVSSYPQDRVQRMRAGEQVHSIYDRQVEDRRTRADTQQGRKERRRTAIIANTPFMNLRYMTIENPEDSNRAFGCPICEHTFKGIGGVRRHASTLLKSTKTLGGAHQHVQRNWRSTKTCLDSAEKHKDTRWSTSSMDPRVIGNG